MPLLYDMPPYTHTSVLRAKGTFPDFLATGVTPCRFSYFQRVLNTRPGSLQKSVLDAGCGKGILAELLAGAGHTVTGIDPSATAIDMAIEHADRVSLRLDYRTGTIGDLPFAPAEFDAVYCCDILEHSDRPQTILAEISRVLKPGGLLFFSSINRTFRSRLTVKLTQEWPLTRFADGRPYSWRHFLTPDELTALLRNAGLAGGEITGLRPDSLPSQLLNIRRFRRGIISYAELGRRYQMRESSNISGSYMGYAIKEQNQ